MVNWELLGNDPYTHRGCHAQLIHNCWELLALPLSHSQSRDALALMQQLSARRSIFRSHYNFIKPHTAETWCDRLVCTHVLPTPNSGVCPAWPMARVQGSCCQPPLTLPAPQQHHPCTPLGASCLLVCTEQVLGRKNSQQLKSITMGTPTQTSSRALPHHDSKPPPPHCQSVSGWTQRTGPQVTNACHQVLSASGMNCLGPYYTISYQSLKI